MVIISSNCAASMYSTLILRQRLNTCKTSQRLGDISLLSWKDSTNYNIAVFLMQVTSQLQNLMLWTYKWLWIIPNFIYRRRPNLLLWNIGLCDTLHISGVCSIGKHDTQESTLFSKEGCYWHKSVYLENKKQKNGVLSWVWPSADGQNWLKPLVTGFPNTAWLAGG